MSDKIGWYQYVPNGFVHAWEKVGWTAIPGAFAGIHHGDYSTLCRWDGEGDPVFPMKEAA